MHRYPAALNNNFTVGRPLRGARLGEQSEGWLNQPERGGAREQDRAAGGRSHLAGDSRHQGSADGQADGHCSDPFGLVQLSLAKYVTCWGRERCLSYTCSLHNCQICL